MDPRSPRALIDTPPVWLAACIALAWVQSAWLPVWPAPAALRVAGGLVVLAGLAFFTAAVIEFRRSRTSIVPRETPRALLTSGPFAWSRNPIYLADTLILLGLILRWDLAALPLVPAFMLLIARCFIAGEEAGCEAAFGDQWRAYAARVRRWV
jgi:protein-S-isoprenylcysteine O-methyltransferase Ste14